MMLKNTGITRKIDTLGRISIPIEIRRNLRIDGTTLMEIYVQGGSIVIRKVAPDICPRCGEPVN